LRIFLSLTLIRHWCHTWMRTCEKVFRLTTLQQIANINGFLFLLFLLLLKNAHVFISYFDNCDCSTWKIEKIDKHIYTSIVHTDNFYRTHICAHSFYQSFRQTHRYTSIALKGLIIYYQINNIYLINGYNHIEFWTFGLYLSHLQRYPMTIDRNKRRCTDDSSAISRSRAIDKDK